MILSAPSAPASHILSVPSHASSGDGRSSPDPNAVLIPRAPDHPQGSSPGVINGAKRNMLDRDDNGYDDDDDDDDDDKVATVMDMNCC